MKFKILFLSLMLVEVNSWARVIDDPLKDSPCESRCIEASLKDFQAAQDRAASMDGAVPADYVMQGKEPVMVGAVGQMPGAGPNDPSVGGTVQMPGSPGMCIGDEGIAPCKYYASPKIHEEMHEMAVTLELQKLHSIQMDIESNR